MSNMAKLLKEAIERAARKQARAETHILERQVALLHNRLSQPAPGAAQRGADDLRFSAGGLQSLRKRLELSARECAILIGVSGWTIGSWERGETRPKKGQIAALAAIPKTGRREVQELIEELAQK
jgi:DNA-binding transcriptional regulator YiaG